METPIGGTWIVTAHILEVLARRSHSSPLAEHKMSKAPRGAPKSHRRCGPVMMCRSREMQTCMISLTGPIGKPSPRPSWQTVKP
jgi:hypothetical protein